MYKNRVLKRGHRVVLSPDDFPGHQALVETLRRSVRWSEVVEDSSEEEEETTVEPDDDEGAILLPHQQMVVERLRARNNP